MANDDLTAASSRPLWWDGLDQLTRPRQTVTRDLDVDVLIVGAGYTGLWAAYYLQELDPALRIAVVEREHVGFGASGRNGGFCYDGFAAGPERIEKLSDLDTAQRWAAVVRESVNVVGEVIAKHGIDCDYELTGTVEFCTNGGQLERARDDVTHARRYGWTEELLRMLTRDEALEIARASGVSGAMWSALSAPIHPARLVHGLADIVEQRGAKIYERSAAAQIGEGVVEVNDCFVSAQMVVLATEGYTAELPGLKRRLAPLYSLMIATEPLDHGLWDEIGLGGRQTFGDMRHLVIYGQRTADGRIAFGGRGAPYDFGSRVRRNADFEPAAFEPVRNALLELFPQLGDATITHRWGGVLGVSRQWLPTVGVDRPTQTAWAGGYVGSGVAASNLAGRTLASLILDTESDLTTFPWVNRRVRSWEPEPLRWLGINAALRVMRRADDVERKTGKPARSAEALWKLATK